MSIQWTLIAGFMYTELGVTFFLLLPFISPKTWNSFFKSRFLSSISNMSHFYFKIIMFVLVIFFVDAIREMRKYSYEIKDRGHEHSSHLDIEMQHHMRLFRAQRNFFISGFSLCLCVIINRLMTLISTVARKEAECEAALQQAKSASEAAKTLIDSNDDSISGAEAKKLRESVKNMEAEKEAALKQAKSVSREYDRLMEELSVLQKEKGVTGDKKAD